MAGYPHPNPDEMADDLAIATAFPDDMALAEAMLVAHPDDTALAEAMLVAIPDEQAGTTGTIRCILFLIIHGLLSHPSSSTFPAMFTIFPVGISEAFTFPAIFTILSLFK